MIERYTRPEMGKIWTPENRYQAWLRVELAVCEAWNRVGEISDADMETLRKEADFTVDRAFVDRANEIEETTRHDVIAFLTAIEEKVGPVSRFIHLGCTSSDIVDTAGSLLMVEAGELILKAFDRVLAVLKKMTLEHQGLLCMGRTHGIHAEPTSFSLKMAGFYAEFKRDRARFAAALDDMRVGKLSGAVGTYTVLSPEVESIVCDLLGLKVDEVSTQVIQRDRHAAYFTALARDRRDHRAPLRRAAPSPAYRSPRSGRRFRQGTKRFLRHAAQEEPHLRREHDRPVPPHPHQRAGGAGKPGALA